MAKKDRLEQIRKVRSLNDVLEIIEDIRKDSEEDEKTAKKLYVSLSAGKGDEVIEISRLGVPGKKRKIKTNVRRTKIDFSSMVKDFKAPPKSAIEKHLAVLQRLYDNAKELEAVEAMLKQSFAGVKNQRDALNSVKTLRQTVDSSIRTALNALNKVASKHVPSELVKLRDHLTSFLLDNIPESQYDDMGFIEYVSLGERGEIHIAVYVEIENLKNSNGYVFDEYIIILTGVVDARGNIAYFVNALPDFRVPGKYALGKQITSENEMEQRVSMLLAHNDIITKYDRAPMPITSDEVTKRGFSAIKGVVKATVADDSLYLQVGKLDKKTEAQVVKDTIVLLNQVMKRRKDANISWKSVTRNGKRYLKFILYFKPGSEPKSLNVMKLGEIKDVLDLDERTLAALRKSMLD